MRISHATFAVLVLCIPIGKSASLLAQEAAAPPLLLQGPINADSTTDASSSELTGPEGLIRWLLIEHLPRTYDNAKKWGHTKPRWNGVSVSMDGLNVRTKRKWKEVNHGTWTRYQAWLIDPE